MMPVGSISFICQHCAMDRGHAHGPALSGGVFSVPAGEWMDTIRSAVDDALTLHDAQGVFYGQGQPICEGHWMDEVKRAVEIQRRVANMSTVNASTPRTVAERLSEFRAFHRFYTTRYTTGHAFYGHPVGWTNDLRFVLKDIEAVDQDVADNDAEEVVL